MTRAKTDPIRPADQAAVAEAARLLKAGQVVAFPTETVYGLGALASSDRAVAGIFAVKRRPRFNPLILHVAEPAMAKRLVRFDQRAEALAVRFWPGPLSLILPRLPDAPASLLCSAGLDSLALRVPSHPVARELLARVGQAVAAPSANLSGQVSPTTARHVAESLGDQVPLILDGGACPVGLESTVIDLTGSRARLLRPGAVTRDAAVAVIGPLDEPGDGPIKSPGQLASHYAPSLPLRLNAGTVAADEALVAYGPEPLAGAAEMINLSVDSDLVEAAARLFATLRRLDRPSYRAIAVMTIPETGLGIAINDRLRRGAAPRS